MPWLLPIIEGLLGPNLVKFAKPLIYLLVIVLLVVGFGVAKCTYDKRIIAAHSDKQAAATAIADKKADDNAADQRRTDDARLTNETTQLERSASNGQTDLDRRLAFQRCLRMQQSARAAKRQPPSCN